MSMPAQFSCVVWFQNQCMIDVDFAKFSVIPITELVVITVESNTEEMSSIAFSVQEV